jgi:hypothetical protein
MLIDKLGIHLGYLYNEANVNDETARNSEILSINDYAGVPKDHVKNLTT